MCPARARSSSAGWAGSPTTTAGLPTSRRALAPPRLRLRAAAEPAALDAGQEMLLLHFTLAAREGLSLRPMRLSHRGWRPGLSRPVLTACVRRRWRCATTSWTGRATSSSATCSASPRSGRTCATPSLRCRTGRSPAPGPATNALWSSWATMRRRCVPAPAHGRGGPQRAGVMHVGVSACACQAEACGRQLCRWQGGPGRQGCCTGASGPTLTRMCARCSRMDGGITRPAASTSAWLGRLLTAGTRSAGGALHQVCRIRGEVQGGRAGARHLQVRAGPHPPRAGAECVRALHRL